MYVLFVRKVGVCFDPPCPSVWTSCLEAPLSVVRCHILNVVERHRSFISCSRFPLPLFPLFLSLRFLPPLCAFLGKNSRVGKNGRGPLGLGNKKSFCSYEIFFGVNLSLISYARTRGLHVLGPVPVHVLGLPVPGRGHIKTMIVGVRS